jgi:hypothetical protein
MWFVLILILRTISGKNLRISKSSSCPLISKFFFFVGLEFELRGSHLQSRCTSGPFCSGYYYFFNFYFIHMCTQCLGHFPPSPTLLTPPPPLPPIPSLPGRNYPAPISNLAKERAQAIIGKYQ